MDRSLFDVAWNGDVDNLVRMINTNPSTLHTIALNGGETPLHVACLAGQFNFVVEVIKIRQDFCMELNQDGFSPLHIAAACGHVEIVKELLNIDLGLCLIKGKDRKIPLHLAVIKGKVGVVKELLLTSLDSVECMTARGETSLHLAVKNNQFETLQVLVEHLKQVDREDILNLKDLQGNTILHVAVSRKQYEVVDFLLNGQVTTKGKIELNSLNRSGLTPLDVLQMFQSEPGDREIEEILIKAGALKAENLQSSEYTQEETQSYHDTRSENPRSPAKKLLDYFKYNNIKDSPSKVRNTLLVIVILITTATYQAALSPPGGVWQDDNPPSTGNNTLSSANTSTTTATAIKPHIAGQAIMVSHNPIAFSIFLFANSMGFYMSLHMIIILTAAFPMRWELQISTAALTATYSACMSAIAPGSFINYGFIGISIAMPLMIPITTNLLRNHLNMPRNTVSLSTNEERV